MRSGGRRSLQVSLQDGCAAIWRNLFQVHLLATTMAKGAPSSCCLHVVYPVHFLSEHRHEVALTSNDYHDERHTDDPAGLPACHLKGNQVIWSDPECMECGPASVEKACHPIGTSTTIELSLQTHHCTPLA